MSDIQKAIDRQAKLEADLDAADEYSCNHIARNLAQHLINQAKLARAALLAAYTLRTSDEGCYCEHGGICSPCMKRGDVLDIVLAAWADHVLGETT